MNTTPNDQHRQDLLTAARKLREHQHSFVRAAHQIAAMETKKKQADDALADAEFELAEADAAYATARLNVLRLIREKRRISIVQTSEYPKTNAARLALWRICATGSDEEIIAAGVEYGTEIGAYWQIREAANTVHADLERAHEVLSLASAARKAAVQKRGRAKADLQAAEGALHAARMASPLESYEFFALESAVTQAAAVLTGKAEQQCAYSYVYTQDLGLTGPGLEMPHKSEPTAEDNVRYWEQHGYGAKREPAREE